MTIPSLLLLGVLSCGLGLSLMAFVRAIVDSGVTGLRLGLWQLHDDVVDGLVRHQYQNPRAARELLAVVRVAIAHARDLTVLNVFGAALVVGPRKSKIVAQAARRSILSVPLHDELLRSHRERLFAVTARSVFRTTAFGRIGLLLLPLAFIVRRLLQRRPVQPVPNPEALAEPSVRTEFKLEMALNAASAGAAPDRQLAGVAC